MVKKIFFLSGLIAFLGLNAQQKHTVEPKETAYSISKRYGLSLTELYQLNPQIIDGNLGIGNVLTVSKNSMTAVVSNRVSEITGKLGHIVLQPKQTIYGITKQYQISEADLRKLNPDLDSHMKIGDKVNLPLENIKKFAGVQYTPATSQVANVTTPTKVDVVTEKEPGNNNDYHTVESRDNYYKISRQYNITQKQLFALNPGLEDSGLKVGTSIRIKGNISLVEIEDNSNSGKSSTEVVTKPIEAPEPIFVEESKPKTSESTITADEYVTYTVVNGDTVFGITNRFNIGLDELLELNPNLSNGLKSGMVLKIKKLDPMYSKKSGDELNVVFMLPFGFDANDNKFRAMSLEFLTGAKLAIERNVAKGMKLDVKVIDAGNESTFKNSISQINQDNTDLIIGPFFKTNVIEVLEFVKSKKIPVVAPFANSSDLFDYSNLIIVETNNEAYTNRLIKEVGQVFSDQKIFILADDNKANANTIKLGLEKSLKNPNVFIVNSANDIVTEQNMMTGQQAPIIAILANDEDPAGNSFTNRIIALTKDVDNINAFSMYYHPSFEKKVDDLSKSNLVYFVDKKINTEGSFEKEVLEDYKQKYCKTPGKFAVVGFDVVNDMLSRENKKGEIFRQIDKVQTQLATKFEFVKTKPNGAYINNGFRVVRVQ